MKLEQDGKRWKEFAQVFTTFDRDSDFDTLDEHQVAEAVCGDHRLEFTPGTRLISRACPRRPPCR